MRLIVAALDSELQAFPATIPGWNRVVTGPGKLLAAVRLTQAIDAAAAGDDPVSEILVAGTAGTLSDATRGTILEVGSAIQHDTSNLEGVVGAHVALPTRITIGSQATTVATGDVFVDDQDEVARVHALGGDIVDMESYAYAWVASDAGIPIRIVKCVSDNAQDGATTLWDEVVAECSADLWRYLEPILK